MRDDIVGVKGTNRRVLPPNKEVIRHEVTNLVPQVRGHAAGWSERGSAGIGATVSGIEWEGGGSGTDSWVDLERRI